ncbi:MAG: DnaJ domain-containing protein [Pyrinomonadaceae bacterium]
MTPQSDLEIKGNFLSHPFAELVTEISQASVSGSLRVSCEDRKCVIYFKNGRVVFAVSNARASRLFDILLTRNRLSKDDLAKIPNFSNDLEFTAYLEDKSFLTRVERDQLFAEQIEGIIVDILTWQSGDWSFSSLKRVRDGLDIEVNAKHLFLDYGRCLPTEAVLKRFRSLDERFHRSGDPGEGLNLNSDEGFVLSRTGENPHTIADIANVAAMTEAKALHAIYTLWLGGLIIRDDWQPAFSEANIIAMRNAKLELKQEAKLTFTAAQSTAAQIDPPKSQAPPEPPKAAEIVLSLDEYLEQVENAATYYDLLGVSPKSDVADIKRAYFGLARMFHPDRYHSEGGDLLRRIQNAFTEMAQAHETLKSPENREIYDYRIRKELADKAKREAAGNIGNFSLQNVQAAENFDRGFSLLMDDEYEDAMPFLARAVHYAPKNARYHAYYGKALSFDESQRHKAESEMQAALKLDPSNPTFRILLAEFFIQVNLLKRAEGELTRLLALFPSNREARDLLDGLQR